MALMWPSLAVMDLSLFAGHPSFSLAPLVTLFFLRTSLFTCSCVLVTHCSEAKMAPAFKDVS